MLRLRFFFALIGIAVLAGAGDAFSSSCIECHKKTQPSIVADWEKSKHAEIGMECEICHGEEHTTAEDAKAATIPTAHFCGSCHYDQLGQFEKGKHAVAWAAMKAMPTVHFQPMELIDGKKGCGGCHKIGLKEDEEIERLKKEGQTYGVVSCDSCHTRHLFSVKEAQQPEACKTCHTGFDHPQYEMYSGAKHGVRHELKARGVLPETAAAPTCQTCHMPKGDHTNMTGWGFLALRLPMPEDKEWAADRATILQALGVLDPSGKPTKRLDVVKEAKVARLTQEEWQAQRDQMIGICSQCHAEKFAKGELEDADGMIKRADHLMAEAIRIVADLYKDGILKKPEVYASAFPDLLTFHDAETSIEQRLFIMFMKHRMRAFQGAFHNNPDYALWYGWSAMKTDLVEIKDMAQELRRRAKL
jgi:hydroxylamine dehydrogenase